MIDFDLYMKTIRSLYVYGKTKSGKTTSVLKYVKEKQYDYTYTTIQHIKSENDFLKLLDSQNVYHMFFQSKIPKSKIKKVIIIDNIDYLQNSDKKLLNCLVKSFKNYSNTYKHIFFIFIGTNETDKKVNDLMLLVDKKIKCIPHEKIDYEKNMKNVVKDYLCPNTNIVVRGQNDKNIISLCFHENIIYHIQQNTLYYEKFLNHFCNGDYYDRLSFQKQLWQFNEMTFYIKVVYNHLLLKTFHFPLIDKDNIDIVFTKILTKFSNEYSNLNFIIALCRRLQCQREELFQNIELLNNQEKKRVLRFLP